MAAARIGAMLASLLLAVTLSAALVPPQDPAEEFRAQYLAALELNDTKAIDALLRKYKAQAVTDFVTQADNRAQAPELVQLSRWVDVFIESWQRVHHSSFARNYDRYLQLLSDSARRSRGQLLRENFPLLLKMHADGLTARSEEKWRAVRVDAEHLSTAFRTLADRYYLALALYCEGNAWNSDYSDSREGPDDRKALACYDEFLAVRDALDLSSDQEYEVIKSLAAEVRARLGIPDPATGEVGERKVSRFEILPAEGAAWVEVPLSFTVEEDPLAIEHPCDLADDHRLSWMLTGTHEPGTEARVHPFEPPVMVRRVALNRFVIDGGAGPSEEFKLSTKPVLVRFQRKTSEGAVADDALMVAGGTDRDMYHGAELNLSVNDQTATMFYRGAGALTGSTPFGPITIYDHGTDGAFGYPELALVGEHGLPAETFLYRYDAVLLGKGKHSQPYSRYLTDGKGGWFEVAREGDYAVAGAIKLIQVAPKLGQLKAVLGGVKGLRLISLVLVSETSQTRGLVVDLMSGKGGVLAVPIGRYRFQQGLLRDPKGGEALILPGTGIGLTVEVEEGATASVELGAPFTFSIARKLEGNKLILDGKTFCIVGAAGERYVRLVGEPPFGIEVELKGEKATGELRGSTAEEVMADWVLAYLPHPLELELKNAAMPPIRMTLRKHPWFGKIDTGWLE